MVNFRSSGFGGSSAGSPSVGVGQRGSGEGGAGYPGTPTHEATGIYAQPGAPAVIAPGTAAPGISTVTIVPSAGTGQPVVSSSAALLGGAEAEAAAYAYQNRFREGGVPSSLPGSVSSAPMRRSYAVVPDAFESGGVVYKSGNLRQDYSTGMKPVFTNAIIGGAGTAERVGQERFKSELNRRGIFGEIVARNSPNVITAPARVLGGGPIPYTPSLFTSKGPSIEKPSLVSSPSTFGDLWRQRQAAQPESTGTLATIGSTVWGVAKSPFVGAWESANRLLGSYPKEWLNISGVARSAAKNKPDSVIAFGSQLRTPEKIYSEVTKPPTGSELAFVATAAIIPAMAALPVWGQAALTGALAYSPVKAAVKNPTVENVTLAGLSAVPFLGFAAKAANIAYIKSFGDYVPPSEVFAKEVLTGKSQFPVTKSVPEALSRFGKPTFEGDTGIPGAPKKGVIVSTATPERFSAETRVKPGDRGDKGLFVTPSGEGSPFFLRAEGAPNAGGGYGIRLLPRVIAPRTLNIRVSGVARQPGSALSSQEASISFVKGQAGSTKAYITRGSEIGTKAIKDTTRKGTGELEAVIPEGTLLKKVPDQPLRYTTYGKDVILIQEYTTVGESGLFGVKTAGQVKTSLLKGYSGLGKTELSPVIPSYSVSKPGSSVIQSSYSSPEPRYSAVEPRYPSPQPRYSAVEPRYPSPEPRYPARTPPRTPPYTPPRTPPYTPPYTPPVTPPSTPPFKPTPGSIYDTGKQKFRLGAPKKGYRPSLLAVEFGLTSKQFKKDVTGTGIRPLLSGKGKKVKGWSW